MRRVILIGFVILVLISTIQCNLFDLNASEEILEDPQQSAEDSTQCDDQQDLNVKQKRQEQFNDNQENVEGSRNFKARENSLEENQQDLNVEQKFIDNLENDEGSRNSEARENSLEEKKIPFVIKPRNQNNDESRNDKTNDVPENKKEDKEEANEEDNDEPIPCTCGVFLSGQFKKGSKKQPEGLPILTQEMDTPFMNNAMGNRHCTNKCLELIIKHLPKSNEIICATVDRDNVYKERAYLFVKNHSDKWHGTNLSAGREYCCKDNEYYKCPPN